MPYFFLCPLTNVRLCIDYSPHSMANFSLTYLFTKYKLLLYLILSKIFYTFNIFFLIIFKWNFISYRSVNCRNDYKSKSGWNYKSAYIARDKGWYISFPLPLAKAIGKSPKIVVNVVIKTGRSLLSPDSKAAASPFIFFSCISWFI